MAAMLKVKDQMVVKMTPTMMGTMVMAIFAKVKSDANAKDEEMLDFSVRKGYTISCYYELPEMFIPYDAPFLIAR
jgi:hypothetical protein